MENSSIRHQTVTLKEIVLRIYLKLAKLNSGKKNLFPNLINKRNSTCDIKFGQSVFL